MTEIRMPRLSDSMEHGTILTWLKQDGDEIAVGEDLVEIETDKATMAYQAEVAGVLRIIAAAGETLTVGVPIAEVDDGTANDISPHSDPAMAGPRAAANADPRAANGPGNGLGREAELDSDVSMPVAVMPSPRAHPAEASEATVKATPLARRVARAHRVVLDQIAGSGPGGRVTRADVLLHAGLAPTPAPASPHDGRASAPPVATVPAALDPTRAAATTPTSAADPGTSRGTITVVAPSRLQAVIARRMAEAKATVPHFQVQTDVTMDAAIALRAQIKEVIDAAPSLNDLVVKAAALALRAHPLANGSYCDGNFELHSRINVAIAVAGEDAIVVPTIFDADQKSLRAIAADTRRLAQSVRNGSVTPAELAGGTFTVSNLGMYGMTAINPVVNQPQAAILGVGSLREQLARVDGEIAEHQMMTLTLSCDHRILYGAEAAQFLSEIRANLEQPLRLAV